MGLLCRLYNILLAYNFILAIKAQYCSQSNVDSCLASFEKYKEEVEDGFFPDHSPDLMRSICSDWYEAETCLRGLLPTCSKADRLVVEGVADGYDYVCSEEGLEIYTRIHSCLGGTTLISQARSCQSTYESRSTTRNPDRLCQYTKEFIDCVDSALLEHCDEEAAEWQRTVHIRTLDPVLSLIGCKLGGGLSTGAIIGLSVGIVALVIIIAIIACCCCCKNRKRNDNTAMNMNAIPSGTTAYSNPVAQTGSVPPGTYPVGAPPPGSYPAVGKADGAAPPSYPTATPATSYPTEPYNPYTQPTAVGQDPLPPKYAP